MVRAPYMLPTVAEPPLWRSDLYLDPTEVGFHRTHFGKHSPDRTGSLEGTDTMRSRKVLTSPHTASPNSHGREKVGCSIQWGPLCLVQCSSPGPGTVLDIPRALSPSWLNERIPELQALRCHQSPGAGSRNQLSRLTAREEMATPVQDSLTLFYSITSEAEHGGNCRSEIAKEPLSH